MCKNCRGVDLPSVIVREEFSAKIDSTDMCLFVLMYTLARIEQIVMRTLGVFPPWWTHSFLFLPPSYFYACDGSFRVSSKRNVVVHMLTDNIGLYTFLLPVWCYLVWSDCHLGRSWILLNTVGRWEDQIQWAIITQRKGLKWEREKQLCGHSKFTPNRLWQGPIFSPAVLVLSV